MIFHGLGLILNREVRRGVAPPKTPPPLLRKERGTQGVRLFHKNQLGFTLTELILAIAIAGIITGGITMTIFQVFSGSARTSNHMTAVRQVQNAGYWVSHDALMAQTEPIIDDDLLTPAQEFLTLTWTDWETNYKHQVVYSFASNTVQRKHYLNDATSPDATLTVSNISSASCSFANGELVFTVTATVGEQTETRVYEVMPRPGS